MNRRYYKIFILLLFTLVLTILGSITIGRYPINLFNMNSVEHALFFNHRLPRIILACIVGASLSCAGATYQGVFKNPMASPDILGASSGAAFGAAIAILLDMGSSLIIVFAFVFSLGTVSLVMFISKKAKGKKPISLILTGIMLSSLVSSGTSFIKLIADPEDQLPEITYWQMGSLNGALPKDIFFSIIPVLLGIVPLLIIRWQINLLTLSEDEAYTMGINIKKTRFIIIICSTLLTAASVAVSGVIGWIGLVIPHLSRKLVGNNYRYLLPVSITLGAIFLLFIDNISRNLYTTEIPIGILTSFVGAPFFIYLITKDGERH